MTVGCGKPESFLLAWVQDATATWCLVMSDVSNNTPAVGRFPRQTSQTFLRLSNHLLLGILLVQLTTVRPYRFRYVLWSIRVMRPTFTTFTRSLLTSRLHDVHKVVVHLQLFHYVHVARLRHKSGGFTWRRYPSVCLFICSFVCPSAETRTTDNGGGLSRRPFGPYWLVEIKISSELTY